MKTLRLCTLLMLLYAAASGQNNTPYNYPVKPGTPAWNSLPSTEARVQACQVPADVLKSLSTEALAITCLNFPFIGELLAAQDLQSGFNALQKHFNGFRELLGRKDAGAALLGLYKRMNAAALNRNAVLTEQGAFTLRFSYLELLLAQNTVIATLDAANTRLLREEAVKKYEEKQTRKDAFGAIGLNTSAWVLGKLLQKDQLQKTDDAALSRFLNTGTFSNPELLQSIYTSSKQL